MPCCRLYKHQDKVLTGLCCLLSFQASLTCTWWRLHTPCLTSSLLALLILSHALWYLSIPVWPSLSCKIQASFSCNSAVVLFPVSMPDVQHNFTWTCPTVPHLHFMKQVVTTQGYQCGHLLLTPMRPGLHQTMTLPILLSLRSWVLNVCRMAINSFKGTGQWKDFGLLSSLRTLKLLFLLLGVSKWERNCSMRLCDNVAPFTASLLSASSENTLNENRHYNLR